MRSLFVSPNFFHAIISTWNPWFDGKVQLWLPDKVLFLSCHLFHFRIQNGKIVKVGLGGILETISNVHSTHRCNFPRFFFKISRISFVYVTARVEIVKTSNPSYQNISNFFCLMFNHVQNVTNALLDKTLPYISLRWNSLIVFFEKVTEMIILDIMYPHSKTIPFE